MCQSISVVQESLDTTFQSEIMHAHPWILLSLLKWFPLWKVQWWTLWMAGLSKFLLVIYKEACNRQKQRTSMNNSSTMWFSFVHNSGLTITYCIQENRKMQKYTTSKTHPNGVTPSITPHLLINRWNKLTCWITYGTGPRAMVPQVVKVLVQQL